MIISDPYFQVRTLSTTPNPYSTIWTAAHGDYSEEFIGDEWQAGTWPNEEKAWKLIEKHLLRKDRPHAGPLEHAQIVIAVGGFPHDVAMQHRTHRLASFDVQSQRYTGERVLQAALDHTLIESVFYARPIGKYHDRQGGKFEYSEKDRKHDLNYFHRAAIMYKIKLDNGMPPEMARHYLPQSIRQNYTFSCNVRSLLHFFDMRTARDAQLEIQTLCEYVYQEFSAWMPELAEWYKERRWGKSTLSF